MRTNLRTVWGVPAHYTYREDRVCYQWDALLLSFRGAERQCPSLLAMALRLEVAITERKAIINSQNRSSEDVLEEPRS